jgi:hypothetical protein
VDKVTAAWLNMSNRPRRYMYCASATIPNTVSSPWRASREARNRRVVNKGGCGDSGQLRHVAVLLVPGRVVSELSQGRGKAIRLWARLVEKRIGGEGISGQIGQRGAG